MSSVTHTLFGYLSELLSLWRKTEAISTLYTISISRSLPVIFGKPPTMIRSISSFLIGRNKGGQTSEQFRAFPENEVLYQGIKGVFRRQDNKTAGRMLASLPITFP